MMRVDRLGKMTIAIACALLLISFLPVGNVQINGNVNPGEYRGRLFGVIGHIYIQIEVEDMNQVSVFILDWTNSKTLMETGTINEVFSLLAIENVTSYQGVVTFPSPGIYSAVVISNINETVQFEIDFDKILPQYSFAVIGLFLIIIGLFLSSIHPIMERSHRKTKRKLS